MAAYTSCAGSKKINGKSDFVSIEKYCCVEILVIFPCVASTKVVILT